MNEEKLASQTPKWLLDLLPLISTILGGGALWFAWLRYNSMVNRPEFNWYDWIQPALIVIVGILCLSATLLFILGKPSGWSVFKVGVSIVPLILFSNLVILVFKVIQSIIQGNAIPFISRLYVSPLNKVILAVVVIIILRSVVKGIENND